MKRYFLGLLLVVSAQINSVVVYNDANPPGKWTHQEVTPGVIDITFGSNNTGYVTADLGINDQDHQINALVKQSDGKLVGAGYSNNSSDKTRWALARFSEDGVLDTTFGGSDTGYVFLNFGDSNVDHTLYALIQQADGKLVAAGFSRNSSGYNRWALARFSKDGVLDTTFGGSDTGYVFLDFGDSSRDHEINALVETSEGKLVAGGYSDNTDDDERWALARFSKDGVLDTTFGGSDTGYVFLDFDTGGQDHEINALVETAEGKLVAGGHSDNASNKKSWALARFSKEGVLDTTFGGNSTGYVTLNFGDATREHTLRELILQSDGKLLAGGYSDNTSDMNRWAIARYSEDGVLDTTFGESGTGYVFLNFGDDSNDHEIDAMLLESNGKIVVAGASELTGSYERFALARFSNNIPPLNLIAAFAGMLG